MIFRPLSTRRALMTSLLIPSKYQYQRGITLSKNLRENVVSYSAEQYKQLQAQSILLYAFSYYLPKLFTADFN